MSTIAELRGIDVVEKKSSTRYVLDYFGAQIEAWNHPAHIAKYILNHIQHTHTFGCQFIAPMGFGKTTAASVIAHHIHKKDERFSVIWGESTDFQHLRRFLTNLPKEPMIIIFDDITGALKEMSDKDMEKNFEDLTKIRWIVDPEKGEVPIITFVCYHYSKNLEKEFRAVLGMSVFLSFGAEEHTNIDTILPKRTMGRRNLEYFSRVSDMMFTQHEFKLMHSNGQVITYKTDQPGRLTCAVMGKDSKLIMISKQDQCEKCAKTHFLRFTETQKILDEIKEIYKGAGKKALRIECMKRGFLPFHPNVNAAIGFIEDKILSRFYVKWDEMAELLRKDYPSKRNRLRKKENESMEEFEKNMTVIPLEKTTSTPTNTENIDG